MTNFAQRTIHIQKKIIHTSISHEMEQRIRYGNRENYRWFQARALQRRDQQETMQRWLEAVTAHQQKWTKGRRRAREQNYHMLAEMLPQLVWITRPDGSLEYVNQRYYAVTQIDGSHLHHYPWWHFLHPEDRACAMELWQRSLQTGEVFENEYRLKDEQTGNYHWFSARILPIRDQAGRMRKWIGTATSIDARKRVEEKLHQSQARVQSFMNSPIMGTFLALEGGDIVEANDTFLHMTGYSRQDLGQHRLNLFLMTPPVYAELTEQAYTSVRLHEFPACLRKRVYL